MIRLFHFQTFLYVTAAVAQASSPTGRTIHVDNHSPRLQTVPRVYPNDGSRIMNSHDEFIAYDQESGLFYKWGITQPNCTGSDKCKADPLHCGWGPAGAGNISYPGSNTFALHTSPDLKTWTWETNDILAGVGYCELGTSGCSISPSGGKCGAFLPKVLYHPSTKKWILWWTCRGCSVATADSPRGPWTISSYNVTYADGAPVCRGSIEFFVDEPTNEAYLIKNWYNHSAQEVVSVERLDSTWTRSAASSTAVAYNAMTTTSSGLIGELGSENAFLLKGPTGKYFLVEPSLCCFCPWGAGASVFTAPTPLGPYTKRAGGTRDAYTRLSCCRCHTALVAAIAM